jgi:transposase
MLSSPLRPYPSDLSDPEWEILALLIPPAKLGGRRRKKWLIRKILNAVFFFYAVRYGSCMGRRTGLTAALNAYKKV